IPKEHAMICGILHGAVLFACLGGFLGSLKKSRKLIIKGIVGGVLSGLLAAGSFYLPFFPLLKLILPIKSAYIGAMILSWITIWKLLANLTGVLNGEPFRPWQNGWRGFFASVISVPGFILITELWKSPGDYNYALAFGAWVIAFFPALVTILLKRPQTSAPEHWISKEPSKDLA
ncbi:MAG: hypothetical protein P1V97_08715, partial [Planctomycetota bacterium]|nr:hypothetical protein [Planctomycetota bacterium]